MMDSQTIAFEDKSPCILDTSVISASKSKLNFLQRGGKKKVKDVTKKFMFLLLKLTTHLKVPEANSNEKCFLKLKPFISNEFKYNKISGDKGLQLLCRHMKELKTAFPNMNLSVTHFKDTDKHSVIVILMVLGMMKGSWLNKPASNKYERLGIVYHLLTNKNRDKITEINFKSEYISEECYKKIRALDLLHTAFAINKSVEEAKRNNGNIKQAKNVEAPLILIQTNRNEEEEDAAFRKEIEAAEKEVRRRELEEAENEEHRRAIEEAGANENAEKLLFGPNKNAEKLEEKIAKENVLPENEPRNVEEDEEVAEEEEPNYQNNQVTYYEEEENEENEENGTNNDNNGRGNSEGINFGVYLQKPDIPLDESLDLQQVAINALKNNAGVNTSGLQNLSSQDGGDGYYTAVEQLPIAGRPVIQGYKSCCKPYFKTSGDEFDSMCQIGGRFGDTGNHIGLRSKTLLMIKNGVIYSITASVIDSIGENTADVMGMKGQERKKIKEHMKRHMHDHTHNVVKEMINNGTPALSSVIPSNDSQIAFIPVRVGGKGQKFQSGGNFIGTIGTLLFPAGNTMDNIVPWLLTLGSVLFKRIEKDVYKVSKTMGRKKVKTPKKVTKKRTRTVTKKTSTKKTSTKKTSTKKTSRKKTSRKVKPLRRKTKRKNVTIKTRKKWEPLTNANIRQLMQKGQLGGECGSGLCGDASLRFFEGCKRPEWGVGAKTPMCI